MMRFLSAFLRDERGAAAAEMALMTPLLLILMFAPFELGNFYWSQHKVTKGVRDAARFAARQPFDTLVCGEEIWPAPASWRGRPLLSLAGSTLISP
jgi:TadE-like protein